MMRTKRYWHRFRADNKNHYSDAVLALWWAYELGNEAANDEYESRYNHRMNGYQISNLGRFRAAKV